MSLGTKEAADLNPYLRSTVVVMVVVVGGGSIIFAIIVVRKRGKWSVNPFLRLYLFGGERVRIGGRETDRQTDRQIFISVSVVLHRRNMYHQWWGRGGGKKENENTLIPAVMTGRTLHCKKQTKNKTICLKWLFTRIIEIQDFLIFFIREAKMHNWKLMNVKIN